MTRRDILIFLFKWKFTIIFVVTTVVATVTALAYLLPPNYRADAKVLVEISRSPVQRSVFVPPPDVQEVMNTETEIILSRTVMTNVVDRLKPHERVQHDSAMKRIRDGLQATLADAGLIEILPLREKWIVALQKSVDAKLVTSSGVINVRYSDEDPEWAARIANGVTDAYLNHHLKIFSEGKSSDLYQRQMEASDATLLRLRGELNERKRRSSVAAIDDSRKSLVQTEATMREQRMKDLTEYGELTARYEQDHQKVKDSAAKIARLDRVLAQAEQQLQKLEKAESSFKEIELAIQMEEQSFKEHKRRYDEAQLNQSADINHVNVRVIDHATVPMQPIYSRMFLIIVSLAGGLVLALSLAFVREYFDRRVLSPQLAEQILGIPELGSVSLLHRPFGDR